MGIVAEKLSEWFYINRYYLTENYYEWKFSKESIDWIEDYDRCLKEYSPCFVLSTGRCGTQLLTALFHLDKTTAVYHSDYLVPNPLLKIYQNRSLHLEDQNALKEVLEASRGELIHRTYRTRRHYVETNSRITFFAHAAKALFPNARFVHLVRNPAQFVISGIRREWYQSKLVEEIGRPRMPDEQMWNQRSLIEKIGWLWNETQRFVEGFKEQHPDDVLTVKSEDLFKSAETAEGVFDFFRIQAPTHRRIRRMIARPVGQQKVGAFTKYEDWPDEDKELLRRGASLFSRYGYTL